MMMNDDPISVTAMNVARRSREWRATPLRVPPPRHDMVKLFDEVGITYERAVAADNILSIEGAKRLAS
jgi:hypothetical protein